MSLGPGARLGPYEVVGAIGAGGMGVVFSIGPRDRDKETAAGGHSDEAGLTRPALLHLRDFGAERLEALDEMAVAALDGLERGHARLPFRRKPGGNQRHP